MLLDLHMPGNHGLAGLAAIRAQYPGVAVVVVSANDDPRVVRRALDHGAAGYLPRAPAWTNCATRSAPCWRCEQWLPAIAARRRWRAVSASAMPHLAARLASLSPQQFRVLALVAEGLLNKQIADRLDVQERTVKAHLSAIFERLGVRNRTQAERGAARVGAERSGASSSDLARTAPCHASVRSPLHRARRAARSSTDFSASGFERFHQQRQARFVHGATHGGAGVGAEDQRRPRAEALAKALASATPVSPSSRW